MAPFNQRQIGYIQAIAGRQQHRTLICGQMNGQVSSSDDVDAHKRMQTIDGDRVHNAYTSVGDTVDAKSLLLHSWLLDDIEATYSSIAAHNDNKLTTADITGIGVSHTGVGMGNYTSLSVFDAACQGSVATADGSVGALQNAERNAELIPSTVRATPDGFLNSTDVKFRFTLPRTVTHADAADGDANTMGQDHYEFRWIVWRNKRPTLAYEAGSGQNDTHANLEAIRDGVSFRNPAYDLFMGQTGRKRGFLGYTLNNDLDKEKTGTEGEAYSGNLWNGSAFTTSGATHTLTEPIGESDFTVDDLLTCRLNKDDYVIMKDVRFFLGKEHGKSHFEDTLHWDWNDPIDTTENNVLTSTTLNDKNYRWHITLIGTSGGKSECALNVRGLWTTKMESG